MRLTPAERHAIDAILDRPYADPDDDAAIAARAALRLAAWAGLDVPRLAQALDVDWATAWHSVPIEESDGFHGWFQAGWDKRELAEIVARAYADAPEPS